MDFLIDPYRMTPAVPSCFESIVMVKQAQAFGGAPINDGMFQAGPAIDAKVAYLASLASYVSADLDHVTASSTIEYDINNPLSLWGGFGQLRGKGDTTNFDSEMKVGNGLVYDSGNGRFNTSSNARGNWYVSPRGWDITLAAPRTAFGCFFTDLGEARAGEIEFRLYLSSVLVRIIAPPVLQADKPSDAGMWMGYKNGNVQFDRIECITRQHSANPAQWDYVGYDDFTVGECVTCVPSTMPQVFYGANTGADAAKTVTGAALTARNAWVASVPSFGVCDFESFTPGSVGPTATTLTFVGSTRTALLKAWQHNSTHTVVGDNLADVIDNNAGSLRWNTTAGGSKWYEWTDELILDFSDVVTAIGFYVTDLGNQNATLRVTLRRVNGSAVSYYLPKAAALPGADSLLRFWGVSGEVQFTRVIIQTVYYTDLTADVYDNPVFHVVSPPDVVGIDDVLIN